MTHTSSNLPFKTNNAFIFQLAEKKQRTLIHIWLTRPHVAEWFYGQGLKNTINDLDDFFQKSSTAQYWLAYDKEHPFAFFITSSINKMHDELSQWCGQQGSAITLDMLIGDIAYLGKGIAHRLILAFLRNQFPLVSEVLIDPEKTNTRAIHVYQKAGFKILSEFTPSHSSLPHYMMRLNMKDGNL